MYQICPHCRKLVSDNDTICPHCGKSPSGSSRIVKPDLWYCPYCNMMVDPRYSKSTKVTTDDLLSIGSFISGEYADSYLFGELSDIKKKQGNNLTCPKCGRKGLQKRDFKDFKSEQEPIKALKMRFVKGDISKEEYLEMKKLLDE